MSFVRPQAKAAIWRLREVLVGFVLVGLGIWLSLGRGSWLDFIGYPMAGGGALIWLGLQRARFRNADEGTGAVQIDEGQVTYFGPLTGGTVALAEMDHLILDGEMFPPHWKLEQGGTAPLLIPVNAVGADALFDAFATLPGLKTERMLYLLKQNSHQAVVIWQRGDSGAKNITLH